MPSTFEGDSRLTRGDRVVAEMSDKDNQLAPGKDGQNNIIISSCENEDGCTLTEKLERENHDYVSGMLYDMLQKEVTMLRKSCQEKDQSLKDKDDAIKVCFLTAI